MIFDKEVTFLEKNNLVRQRWRLQEWSVNSDFTFANKPCKSAVSYSKYLNKCFTYNCSIRLLYMNILSYVNNLISIL